MRRRLRAFMTKLPERTQTNADVHVLLNDTSLFDSTVLHQASVSYASTPILNAGDVIDYVVGYGYDNTSDFDRVILSANIASVKRMGFLILQENASRNVNEELAIEVNRLFVIKQDFGFRFGGYTVRMPTGRRPAGLSSLA